MRIGSSVTDSSSPLPEGEGSKSMATILHRLADFFRRLRLLLRLALVVQLLAAGDADLHLGAPLLEVQPQRDERVALLGSLAGELGDLALVQEQLARPLRLVVEAVPHRV